MEKSKIHTVLYTVPQAACDAEKMNWQDVAALVKNKLLTSFKEKVSFEHIEFMSQEWFDDTHSLAQSLLETGQVNFPFVLVDGEIACADKKINLSKVHRIIQSRL